MGLNKQKGNMYSFVSHTWNPIRGKCPHDCIYCYMKVYPQPELHFVEKEMETNLSEGNFIFVGSSTDMWCKAAWTQWIMDTLKHCRQFDNRYLFQSKNPDRFLIFASEFPNRTILGTTIETSISHVFSEAPAPRERLEAMIELKRKAIPRMVSIEPIIDFNLNTLVDWIRQITPEFVSIGADSKGHNLPEPPADKVNMLIEKVSEFTEVKIKDNLKRLRQEMPA